MASNRTHKPTLKSLSKRQWMVCTGAVLAIGLTLGAGVIGGNAYRTSTPESQTTSFSATAPAAASRSAEREDLARGADGNTSYVTVKINGKSTTVLGSDFTTVKSVLDQGDIVLEPSDTVTPALDEPVDESTVIVIERAGATVETSETAIAFNEVRKETADLPKGTEKVEQEGADGVMETTNLVTRAGDTVVSSNAIASWVKQAPTDRVVLVGTGVAASAGSSSGSGSGASLGVTVPASTMQQWAHDYLIANGYSESDFTAANYIITRESGWNPSARNPSSGAYGLAQALPGSKMASAGADWATNYQTQFRWFLGYCNGRYGSLTGAYNFWTTHHWY